MRLLATLCLLTLPAFAQPVTPGVLPPDAAKALRDARKVVGQVPPKVDKVAVITQAAAPAANACVAGVACKLKCMAGHCAQTCPAGGACEFTCAGGACTQLCEAGATCDFTCSGGTCAQTVRENGVAKITCSGGKCTRQLAGTVSQSTCTGGDCQ